MNPPTRADQTSPENHGCGTLGTLCKLDVGCSKQPCSAKLLGFVAEHGAEAWGAPKGGTAVLVLAACYSGST